MNYTRAILSRLGRSRIMDLEQMVNVLRPEKAHGRQVHTYANMRHTGRDHSRRRYNDITQKDTANEQPTAFKRKMHTAIIDIYLRCTMGNESNLGR
jgi:hypothetical protein